MAAAGNNKVDALRELSALKELPKLIILDLQGNPMCDTPDYFLYTIYQLRTLRVLDGAGISPASKAAAKAKYAGRLTLEFLEDKAGLSNWARYGSASPTREQLLPVVPAVQRKAVTCSLGIQKCLTTRCVLLELAEHWAPGGHFIAW